MLNHKDGVSLIDKPLNDFHKLLYVRKVQSRRRLVHNIKRLARRNTRKFICKFDALCFAAGKCQCRLSKLNVAESYGVERFKFTSDVRNGRKK